LTVIDSDRPTAFRALGIAQLVLGIGLAIVYLVSYGFEDPGELVFICPLTLVFVTSGIGLLTGRSWGRVLALIVHWAIALGSTGTLFVSGFLLLTFNAGGGPDSLDGVGFMILTAGAGIAGILVVVSIIPLWFLHRQERSE
jgi:hypothetical protein